MTEHCFISYSTADGIEFTRKIADSLEGGEQFIPAWFDKRDLKVGEDWDEQIVEAIKGCKCFLFVMTEDSTKAASNCKPEIVLALKYKKPIVPILLQKNVDQPFLLGSREWIDFTSEFKAGFSKLRIFLSELDSPEGELRILKYRLADAEHALRRALGYEEKRVKTEIAGLKAQIHNQEDVIRNLKTTKTQNKSESELDNDLKQKRRLRQVNDNEENRILGEIEALKMQIQRQENSSEDNIRAHKNIEDAKLHLEFIHSTITRMNANSFQAKGLMLIVVCVILVLYANTKNDNFALLAIFPVIIFWFLDAYYLWQERKFRGLYNDVAGLSKDPKKIELFAMRPDLYTGGKYSFWDVFLSITILPLYGLIIEVLAIIYFSS